MTKRIDLTGHKYGLLLVLNLCDRKTKQGGLVWGCRCSCGRLTEVASNNLRSGQVLSCGCLSVKKSSDRARTHGKSKTKIYRIWRGMITRCSVASDTNYHKYGQIGISVCKEWMKFEKFYADMGEPPNGMSLDRIDNNKGYSKSNCRWATNFTQSRNRKNNNIISFDGKSMCISDWSKHTGIGDRTIYSRIHKYGWSIRDALRTKPRRTASSHSVRGLPGCFVAAG